MKRTPMIVICLIVTSAVVYACAGNKAGAAPRTLTSDAPQKDQVSYDVGFYLGREVREGLRADDVEANTDLLVSGFIDGLAGAAHPPLRPAGLDEAHRHLRVGPVNKSLRQQRGSAAPA